MYALTSSNGRFAARIVYDDDPINPREEYDHATTIVYHSSRYRLGDVDIDPDDFHLPENVYALPVYAYIHSDIALRLGSFGWGFDPWDSGQSGIMYMPHSEAPDWQRAYEIMAVELEEFEAYLNGEVYGVIYYDAETGEELDAIYGYYGYESAEAAAREYLEDLERAAPEDESGGAAYDEAVSF